MTSKTLKEIEKYESFLNDKLRPDYVKAIDQREKILSEMRDYESLLVTVETMKKLNIAKVEKLKTRVNLGKHFFVTAEADYNDKIIVKLLDGMFAELPLARATTFIEEKIKILDGRATAADHMASHIRAHIDIVLSSITDYAKLAQARQ